MVVEYIQALDTVYPAEEGRIQFITDSELDTTPPMCDNAASTYAIMYTLLTAALVLTTTF